MPDRLRLAALALAIALAIGLSLVIAWLRRPPCAGLHEGDLIRLLHCKGDARHG